MLNREKKNARCDWLEARNVLVKEEIYVLLPFYIECCFHYLHLGLNALLLINYYLHLIHNRMFLRPLFLEACIYLLVCMCVLYSEPIPLSVCALFPSLYVLMQSFRINTAFKLLELLSFKAIFMRRKKYLSLI